MRRPVRAQSAPPSVPDAPRIPPSATEARAMRGGIAVSRRANIGHIVRATGLTIRAIRLYEERRLVASVREPSGVRSYDEQAQDRLAFIARARRVGVGLSDIQELLELGDLRGAAERDRSFAAKCRERLKGVELERQLLIEFISKFAP